MSINNILSIIKFVGGFWRVQIYEFLLKFKLYIYIYICTIAYTIVNRKLIIIITILFNIY